MRFQILFLINKGVFILTLSPISWLPFSLFVTELSVASQRKLSFRGSSQELGAKTISVCSYDIFGNVKIQLDSEAQRTNTIETNYN